LRWLRSNCCCRLPCLSCCFPVKYRFLSLCAPVFLRWLLLVNRADTQSQCHPNLQGFACGCYVYARARQRIARQIIHKGRRMREEENKTRSWKENPEFNTRNIFKSSPVHFWKSSNKQRTRQLFLILFRNKNGWLRKVTRIVNSNENVQ
jgi:hypothetical protein